MIEFFLAYGRPERIRTDGGPCFNTSFQKWASSMGIISEISSPRHPESNGLSESAVKRCETIIQKSHLKTQEDIDTGILAYNSKMRVNGQGRPIELFLKRRVRYALPSVNKTMLATAGLRAKRQHQLELIRMRSSKRKQNALFSIGDKVRIRDSKLGTWKEQGEIVELRNHKDKPTAPWSYWVKNLENGTILLKAARELRRSYSDLENTLVGGVPAQ